MKKFFYIITISVFASCSSSKHFNGTYKSNFADLGFFITKIQFNKDSTYIYNLSGDLIHQELGGSYKIKNRTVYLKFNTEKGEIESEQDSLSVAQVLTGNFHNYELKEENGIKFHRKFKTSNNKLISYRVDNGKIVKYSRYYSDKKRYLLFGPTWRMKKSYLKKISNY